MARARLTAVVNFRSQPRSIYSPSWNGAIVYMLRLVHNWRILLGGLASASVLAVSVAAPTFARSVSRAGDRPTSARSVSRAGHRSASARSVSRAGHRSASTLTGVAPRGSAAGGGCDLPGLPQAGRVIWALAGAPVAPCGASDLGSVTASTSGISGRQADTGSLTGSLAGASAVTGALSGLGSVFGGAQLGSRQP